MTVFLENNQNALNWVVYAHMETRDEKKKAGKEG